MISKRVVSSATLVAVESVTAADLAKRYLDQIQKWSKAAEVAEFPAERVRYAALERGALKLYASLSGQEAPAERVLLRSPAWVRLRGIIIGVLSEYPDALDAVEKALREAGYS